MPAGAGPARRCRFTLCARLSSEQANCDGNYPYGGADKLPLPGAYHGGRVLQAKRLRSVRHAWQRLGVVSGLVR